MVRIRSAVRCATGSRVRTWVPGSGKLAWSDATKATHVLSSIARLIVDTDLERRIEALERGEGIRPPERSDGRDHLHHRARSGCRFTALQLPRGAV